MKVGGNETLIILQIEIVISSQWCKEGNGGKNEIYTSVFFLNQSSQDQWEFIIEPIN